MTKPDSTNAVQEVARHAQDPAKTHWRVVLKILAYLKITQMLGLTSQKVISADLVIYSDPDFARKK